MSLLHVLEEPVLHQLIAKLHCFLATVDVTEVLQEPSGKFETDETVVV